MVESLTISSFHDHCRVESDGKRILKIGQYLPKLWARIVSVIDSRSIKLKLPMSVRMSAFPHIIYVLTTPFDIKLRNLARSPHNYDHIYFY